MPAAPKRHGFWGRMKRIIRYRLHIPMQRNPHPPEFVARGVMVGTAWAISPIFGLQMAAVLITWFVARHAFRWDFSLVNGLAWTWTTNAFTVLPAYYLCYVTGQVMLGRWDDITGYGAFVEIIDLIRQTDLGYWQAFVASLTRAIETIGLPMLLGSIPWAAFFGWLAYKLSYQFVVEYRKRRARRMQAARTSNGKAPGTAGAPRKRVDPIPTGNAVQATEPDA